MDSLIITERYLKENSIVDSNTDMKNITATIILVQDFYIHPILGTDLFNEIAQQIEDSDEGKAGTGESGDEVSEANRTLLNKYILPTMLWYILCECTPVFKYRYMNKGVMVKNSENSAAADLSEIKFLMDKWKNNAEMYAQRATNFLRANTADYPLYIQNTDCDDIKPNRNNYTTSIYLGDERSDEEDYNIRIGNYD